MRRSGAVSAATPGGLKLSRSCCAYQLRCVGGEPHHLDRLRVAMDILSMRHVAVKVAEPYVERLQLPGDKLLLRGGADGAAGRVRHACGGVDGEGAAGQMAAEKLDVDGVLARCCEIRRGKGAWATRC